MRVADTITEWRSDERKARITVAQLLSMTDGLAGKASGPGPVETYAEAVALPSVNEPGAGVGFSDLELFQHLLGETG